MISLTITQNAIDKLKDLISKQEPAPGGIRLAVTGGGCSGYEYKLGFTTGARTLDECTEHDGLKIFVDALSALYLDGLHIGYQESMMSSNFVFDNPNAKRSCGCGNSFAA